MKNTIILLGFLLFTSCASIHNRCEKESKEVITTMVNAIDTKEWDIALDQFDRIVYVDYESLSGQPGADVPSKELVGNWSRLLKIVKTHHMLTNFDVEINGDEAEIFSHVYASHDAKKVGYWDAYGRYHHKLKKKDGKWKITYMKLIMHGQKGNKKFLQQVSK